MSLILSKHCPEIQLAELCAVFLHLVQARSVAKAEEELVILIQEVRRPTSAGAGLAMNHLTGGAEVILVLVGDSTNGQICFGWPCPRHL